MRVTTRVVVRVDYIGFNDQIGFELQGYRRIITGASNIETGFWSIVQHNRN